MNKVDRILHMIMVQSIHPFRADVGCTILQPWEHMIVLYNEEIAIKYIWDTREVTGIIENIGDPTTFLTTSNVTSQVIDNRKPLRCSNIELYKILETYTERL